METLNSGHLRRPFSPRDPVFASLSTSDYSCLSRLGFERSFEANTAVFTQEEPAKHVYVVVEGRINIIVTSAAGREHIVRVTFPGDLLGLCAALAELPFEATAVTSTPVRVEVIQAGAFQDFLLKSPSAIACVARALSEEYLDVLENAKLLQITRDTAGRVARVLLSCAPAEGRGLPFPFMFTHADIGNMAGCSRESATRMFGIFRKREFIDTGDRSLTILEPDLLLGIAGLN